MFNLGIILWLSLSAQAETRVSFQTDRFEKKSACRPATVSMHNVLRLKFQLAKKDIPPTGLYLDAQEAQGEKQIIHYKHDHFFYPGLFSAPGHREFNLPQCDEKDLCDFNLFVFTTPWMKLPSSVQMKLDIKSLKDQSLIKTIDYPFIAHPFLNALEVPAMELTYESKIQTAFLKIKSKEVKKLKNDKINAYIIFHSRQSPRQVAYTSDEHEIDFSKLPVDKDFVLTTKLAPPSYLGALVWFEKNHYALENKILILDQTDPLFKCP